MSVKKSAKQLVARVARSFGYKIARMAPGQIYTPCPPYAHSTYSPWFEDWFQEKFDLIRHRTAVKEDRAYILYRMSQAVADLEGEYAECGVYRGGTALLTAMALEERKQPGRRMHLFDTFEGMPEKANTDPSNHEKGDFNETSLESVKELLHDHAFVDFYPGEIPGTLEAVKDKQFAFVHIDVDLYETTKSSFEFFYSRMVRGGIMLCDDYGFLAYEKAAKLAMDEFFADKMEHPMSLRTGQCLVIKQA